MSTRRGFLGKLLGGAAAGLVPIKVPEQGPESYAKTVQPILTTEYRPQNIGSIAEDGDFPRPPRYRVYEGFYNPTDKPLRAVLHGKAFMLAPKRAVYIDEQGVLHFGPYRG